MSGATLATINEKDLSDARIEDGRIIAPVGKTTAETFILLGEGELTRRLGLSLDGIGPGGIVIKSGGNTIALLARPDGVIGKRSSVNARVVFNFLEALGCRCLWPGEIKERSGSRKTHDHRVRPQRAASRPSSRAAQPNIRLIPAQGAAQLRSRHGLARVYRSRLPRGNAERTSRRIRRGLGRMEWPGGKHRHRRWACRRRIARRMGGTSVRPILNGFAPATRRNTNAIRAAPTSAGGCASPIQGLSSTSPMTSSRASTDMRKTRFPSVPTTAAIRASACATSARNSTHRTARRSPC